MGRGELAIGLRADIDALPVLEETGLPYASVNEGVAHACGHDIHTTVMLGAALTLKKLDDEGLLNARVRVIFQPAEEKIPGGALSVIEQGVLDEVPRILALHCDPRIDVGQIGTRIGAITSASDTIRIEVNGRGGHTSRPHLTEDVVFAMSQIATQVPAVLAARSTCARPCRWCGAKFTLAAPLTRFRPPATWPAPCAVWMGRLVRRRAAAG